MRDKLTEQFRIDLTAKGNFLPAESGAACFLKDTNTRLQ